MTKLAAALITGAVVLFLVLTQAHADEARISPFDNVGWNMDKMNRQIDETNVVVGDERGAFCSGTIINKEAGKVLILTAAHCASEKMQTEEIEFEDPETGEIKTKTVRKKLDLEIWHNRYADYQVIASTHYVVKIVAFNKNDDIALLQVKDATFAADMEAPLAPDAWIMRRGQRIYAVGNPLGDFDNSITDGIISNTQRTLTIDGIQNQYFQFSAPVVGGNSGGAIYNTEGEIVGTVSAGVRGENIGFGVPVAKVKNLMRSAGFGDIAGWPAKSPDQPQAGR